VSVPLFTLRSATASDYAWLWELKRLTMRTYVEQTWGNWDDEAQEEFFRRNFSSETVQIIEVEGKDAGLLNVEREPGVIFLANLQIHPSHQNRGIGTAVIQDVVASAKSLGLSVRLQVLRTNRDALRLYQRLGFVGFKETPTHTVMRWERPRFESLSR
jgi:ribosomal protein S18 acetylase RimI-like enzyme